MDRSGERAPVTRVETCFSPPDDERSRALSAIAHELRNPLTSALWSIDLIQQGVPGQSREARSAAVALRSLRRLRVVIEDFLLLERLPSASASHRLDLAELTRRACGPSEWDSEPLDIEGLDTLPAAPIQTDAALAERLVSALTRRACGATSASRTKIRLLQEPLRWGLEVSRAGVSTRLFDDLTVSGVNRSTALTPWVARVLAHRLELELERGVIDPQPDPSMAALPDWPPDPTWKDGIEKAEIGTAWVRVWFPRRTITAEPLPPRR